MGAGYDHPDYDGPDPVDVERDKNAKRPKLIRITHADVQAFKRNSKLRRGATDNQRKGERR